MPQEPRQLTFLRNDCSDLLISYPSVPIRGQVESSVLNLHVRKRDPQPAAVQILLESLHPVWVIKGTVGCKVRRPGVWALNRTFMS